MRTQDPSAWDLRLQDSVHQDPRTWSKEPGPGKGPRNLGLEFLELYVDNFFKKI